MILEGARVAVSASEAVRMDLTIRKGRVFYGRLPSAGRRLDLRGHLILPGLINAHDHLEFNLYPRLGRPPYANATEWAADVYRPHESPIREVLGIPKAVRLFWGGIKNLLSGVTTVMHHNPYQAAIFERGFPVRVVERYGWAHSLRFSPDFRERFAATPAGAPFVIHAAEGTDSGARDEIARLDAAGALGPSTVVVHGVALDEDGIRLMRQRSAGLVWCPTSNCFTLGRTISREVLDSGIPIALGTDSTLTAAGDLLDELRFAGRMVEPRRLYRMVTRDAANLMHLDCGEGRVRQSGAADLLVIADHGGAPSDALAEMRPELVMVRGVVKLISSGLEEALGPFDGFRPLAIEGRGRWFLPASHVVRIERLGQLLPQGLQLAGRAAS